jgi:hypothetical protein
MPKSTSRKFCCDCGKAKPTSEFHKNTQKWDGLAARCKECAIAYRKRYDATPEGYRKNRSRLLKHNYGITLEQYEEMLAAQNGVCAVCGEVNEGGRALSVDHDHTCCSGPRSCGRCIRKLLCAHCNHAIGNAKEDADRLVALAAYLVMHRGVVPARSHR